VKNRRKISYPGYPENRDGDNPPGCVNIQKTWPVNGKGKEYIPANISGQGISVLPIMPGCKST
jgi:hypothetical protein